MAGQSRSLEWIADQTSSPTSMIDLKTKDSCSLLLLILTIMPGKYKFLSALYAESPEKHKKKFFFDNLEYLINIENSIMILHRCIQNINECLKRCLLKFCMLFIKLHTLHYNDF